VVSEQALSLELEPQPSPASVVLEQLLFLAFEQAMVVALEHELEQALPCWLDLEQTYLLHYQKSLMHN
jgi:hypothetical protein